MPVYDFRCNVCGRDSALFYKTYRAYDSARDAHSLTCAHCGATDLTRLISRVAIAKPSVNYGAMSSGEMLNVFEGGDSREIGKMFTEAGGEETLANPEMASVAKRLLNGEAVERVARDLETSPPSLTPP